MNLVGPDGTAETRGVLNVRRRLFLSYGLGSVAVVAVAGTVGAELVSRGELPGKSVLDDLDGACSVPAPDLSTYAPPGPRAAARSAR
jgi:hypothetical protein